MEHVVYPQYISGCDGCGGGGLGRAGSGVGGIGVGEYLVGSGSWGWLYGCSRCPSNM